MQATRGLQECMHLLQLTLLTSSDLRAGPGTTRSQLRILHRANPNCPASARVKHLILRVPVCVFKRNRSTLTFCTRTTFRFRQRVYDELEVACAV